jgi:hypothetical protein
MKMTQGIMMHGKKQSHTLTVVISPESDQTLIGLAVADEK